MILVTGAAGKTGRALVRALSARGESVRAFVRRVEQIAPLKALGAQEALVGDMLNEADLKCATDGVRAIYHIPPNVSPHEVEIGECVIAAAQAAGVQHFVYHSVLHPQVEAMPHHWLKMRVEEALFASGLPFTILQPCAYMQNIAARESSIRERGVYSIPYPPQTRLSLIDVEDVAQAAAVVLTEPDWYNAVIELVGTAGMTQSEVALVLSEALARPVEPQEISLAEWQTQARAAGMGEYQIETLRAMFRYYARQGLSGNPRFLQLLLKRAPTSFAEYVRRTMAEPFVSQLSAQPAD
ncbi:MAG: NmrA family NAD(P)-binding protein [Anaerolineales bacterium]|nr:NmrA family NAD(P)-binding protein [Anaerolineales bacterium]MCL4260497.1 NmrA family NAD(P)-binding protein [Anaerolineales bacterium]